MNSGRADHRRWTAVEAIELSDYAGRGASVDCPACASVIEPRTDRRDGVVYVEYTCQICENTALFGFAAPSGAGHAILAGPQDRHAESMCDIAVAH